MKKTIFFTLLICSIFACNSSDLESEFSKNSESSTKTTEGEESNKSENPKQSAYFTNDASFHGKPLAKHVIMLTFDGWASYSYYIQDIPNIKAMAKKGSMTLKKRSVLPSSSAVNWATMLMGCGPEVHGYTTWGSESPDIPAIQEELNENGMFPTIFYLMQDQRPDQKVGCVYEWSGMKYVIDYKCLDYWDESSDYTATAENFGTSLKTDAIKYIKEEKPNLFAVVWANPDVAGHTYGWDSDIYFDVLTEVDKQVGEVIQAVKDAGIYDETVFVFASDHGGKGTGHGGTSLDEVESPFIICGKNIKSGYLIKKQMMQYDVSPTIATILGLRCPSIWIGRSMNEVFTVDIKE